MVPAVRWYLLLLLAVVACSSKPLRKLDVHTHLNPGSLDWVLPLLEAQGVDRVVNLSGGRPGHGLEQQLQAAQKYPGHVIVFCTPDFDEAAKGEGYGERLAAQLEQMQALGCR